MTRAMMRRQVIAAGGYYSRQSGQWVIPGARHNCTPWATDTQWYPTLEDAYAAAEDAARANAEVYRYGAAEAGYIRG